MSLLFLYIKDIKKSTEYIYNSKPIKKNELEKSFDNIYATLKSSNPNLKKNQSETFCEIYEDSVVLNKGWVWNETINSKNILYIISTIPYLSLSNNNVDKSTQTDIQTNFQDKINQSDNYKDDDYDDECDETTINIISNNLSNLNFGYSNNILFPDLQTKLVDELKLKLKEPNFGLFNYSH